jgi:hypothetical protein
MKAQLDLAKRAPGFNSEADVVRYALEQALPGLLPAEEPYAGRTRMLVDTASAAERVAASRPVREPVRLRYPEPEPRPDPYISEPAASPDNVDPFAPLDDADVASFVEIVDQHAREAAKAYSDTTYRRRTGRMYGELTAESG